MVVKCAKCGKKYKIDSSKITEKGVKVTCPNCENVFVVRKKAEGEEKEDFTPCYKCGEPATLDLDTDQPICDRCKTKEQETAARFVPMSDDDNIGSPMDREIDLKDGNDISFGDLSEGDFAPDAYSSQVLAGEKEPAGNSIAVEETLPEKKNEVESFVESPHETAAAIPTEPEAESDDDFFDDVTAAPPQPPSVEPAPPPPPANKEIPQKETVEPANKPSPPPVTKPLAKPPSDSVPTPPDIVEESELPEKSSPVPLIITTVLLGAIIFYLLFYVFKIF